MESHLKERPKKTIFPKQVQKAYLKKAKTFILKDLLPNNNINKIIIFGSITKGTFGRYEKLYKGRTYSDVDILLLVNNNFKTPKTWKKHFLGNLYKVYNRIRLERKITIQYLVSKEKIYKNLKNKKEAEIHGVPLLLNKSKHPHIIIYEK